MTKAADRKDAHIALALDPLAQSVISAGFDRVRLDHCALPELDLATVNLATSFLDRALSSPLYIGAMTGGTDRADTVNAALAIIANESGVPLSIGSQRAAIEAGRSQRNLRDLAPDVPLIGNLGGVQLAAPGGIDLAMAAVDDLQADALAIHLNPLQEAVQIEGETDWRNVSNAIEMAVAKLPCKLIVKEVGAGISPAVAARLFALGVYAVDVAGLGGTNWTRIEAARLDDAELFAPFLDWGLPTVDCLTGIHAENPDGRLIASGGVRSGLDVAKSIWLGASMVSIAGPVLTALVGPDNGTIDEQAALAKIGQWQEQLALTLYLTGSVDLAAFGLVQGSVADR